MLRKEIVRWLGAAAASLAGTVMVFLFLDWMNRNAVPPQKKLGKGSAAFTVEKPREEKQVERLAAPPRQRPRPIPTPRAPLPNLVTALAGINFRIPTIGGDALEGIENSVLGSDAALSEVTMTAQSVDAPPKPEQQVSPEYPPGARAEAVTGHVKLRFLVGSDGSVHEVKVLEAQPKGVFEDAAKTAIQKWRYSPARYRGLPVKMWAEMVMRFNLS
jgi:protein TonB